MRADLELTNVNDLSLAELLSREWLVTNGLGGYASGTVLGPSTRKYHGAFVPNLSQPNGRHVLLPYLADRLELPQMSASLWGELGAQHLRAFRLDAGMPTWGYAVGGHEITRQVVMPHGRNLACLLYEVAGPEGAAAVLRLRPFLSARRHDEESNVPASRRLECCIRLGSGPVMLESCLRDAAVTMRIAVVGAAAEFVARSETLSHRYSVDEDRGYGAGGTDFSPGEFAIAVRPGSRVAFIASLEPFDVQESDVGELFAAERQRVLTLLRQAGDPDDPLAARLVVAADQFIIRPGNRPEEELRAQGVGEHVRTVIAGYHWFGDWGRDTMISLEGLTLCTGRHAEAAAILRTFAGYVRDGLVPNLFPEGQREALYHTADATLWMFHSIERYRQWTRDIALVEQLLPVLVSICEHYRKGTRYGIGVDPDDGLVRAAAPGYQLTWMDAKAGDWVVTPRRGKPVEIQALWYNALRLMADWHRALGLPGERYDQAAAEVYASFNRRFWSEGDGHLLDVVDGETGDDRSGRPNQIFALSLPHPVLDEARWAVVLEYVRRELLTPYGLRTLSSRHPDYRRNYHGDLINRDGAYHQGTVWPWLMGPYLDAQRRVDPRRATEELPDLLAAFRSHLTEFGIGSIAEIFDAEAPHIPRGCIAQAWSVAEVLRSRLRRSDAK